MDRLYYSQRTGKNPCGAQFDLPNLKRLFLSLYRQLSEMGYFQEDLGFECVDAGFVPGRLGTDLEAELLLAVRKSALWPIYTKIEAWSEDDLFDTIEFLFDHVSQPTEKSYHSYNDCGWHCTTFDRRAGQAEYRAKLNRLLALYDNGFELSEAGQLLALPDNHMEPLLSATVPSADPNNITSRVEVAVAKFRRHRSSLEDRRDAIRDLADVLEFLRPDLESVLTKKDESDLFNLANNFGIRHHNQEQKRNYDRAIWYSWLFYYYLATIQATTRLIARTAAGAA